MKGGDPIEFKKINDAYNKLISHVNKLDAIESEAELSRTSVIIEISKQAVPKWKEKLKATYGLPKISKVKSVLFNVSTKETVERSHGETLYVKPYLSGQCSFVRGFF